MIPTYLHPRRYQQESTGTKRREYLEENTGAADVTLTEADLERIQEVAPAGERYNEAGMGRVGR